VNIFFQNIFSFIFLLVFLVVFILAFIIIRPFRLHKGRPLSTIALKLSYLLYLFVFLSFSYFLFFGEVHSFFSNEGVYMPRINFILTFLAFIIPNTGILFRRKVRKKRTHYNMAFFVMNLFTIAYLVYTILQNMWLVLF
jgi:hypothetical protein